jgi:hypothetical protein
MSSLTLEQNLSGAKALNNALRASMEEELRLANLEATTRWLSVLIVVLVLLSDGFELIVAALLWVSGGPIRSALSPALIALHKRLMQLDTLDAALSERAPLEAGDEFGWARWAELSARTTRAHGAAFEELPLTDAQRRLGAKLAAADRLERLTDAIDVEEAHIARLQRARLPGSILAVVMAIAVPFVVSHLLGRSAPQAVFLTTLWSILLGFGVVLGFGAKIKEHQTQASRLEAQATPLRALMAEANALQGAALMDRWLTLRAQQEDELLPWPTILEPTTTT